MLDKFTYWFLHVPDFSVNFDLSNALPLSFQKNLGAHQIALKTSIGFHKNKESNNVDLKNPTLF